MDGYVSPYNRRPYGGLLSATQGFLNAYLQHAKLRQEARQTEIMNQFRQSMEVERSLDIGYKRKRLEFVSQHPQEAFGRRPTQIFTPGRISQTLGELESGGAASMLGYVIPFGSREDAINHALRKLGPNWEELAPGAKEIIDRKFPGEVVPDQTKPPDLSGERPSLGGLFSGADDWLGESAPEPEQVKPEGWLRRNFPFQSLGLDWIRGKGVFKPVPERPAEPDIPAGLEPIWGELTDEEKETAKEYLQQHISPERIIQWFNRYGNYYQFPKKQE